MGQCCPHIVSAWACGRHTPSDSKYVCCSPKGDQIHSMLVIQGQSKTYTIVVRAVKLTQKAGKEVKLQRSINDVL